MHRAPPPSAGGGDGGGELSRGQRHAGELSQRQGHGGELSRGQGHGGELSRGQGHAGPLRGAARAQRLPNLPLRRSEGHFGELCAWPGSTGGPPQVLAGVSRRAPRTPTETHSQCIFAGGAGPLRSPVPLNQRPGPRRQQQRERGHQATPCRLHGDHVRRCRSVHRERC